MHVFGENGFEAVGIPFAPSGWIEMQFTFRVAPDGTVSVIADSTKKFPSISIYSYQSNGSISNVWQQKESGSVNDLNQPRSPGNGASPPQSSVCSAEFSSC
jgi:hypothetical protein